MTESYCDKVHRLYVRNAYPAAGASGPAQQLHADHLRYETTRSRQPTMGSDSWPGANNPTTARMVR